MRLQSNRGNVLFFGVIGAALLAVVWSLFFWPIPRSQSSPVAAISNAIVNENAHFGTNSWQIPADEGATTQIQAYASATSVSPGQQLTFYVSTQTAGTIYSISIYRLGWYGGLGGRLTSLQVNQIGQAQGYFDQSAKRLVGCNSCHVDTQIGLVEADWQPSYTFTVPSDWTTGFYLAKFSDANHWQTYAPFDVRGNPHSRYIVVTADTTNEAYNTWGGNSLYGPDPSNEASGSLRSMKVSFDRPYVQSFGAVLQFGLNAIHWFEMQPSSSV